ncbi:hypothetical protein MRX96_059248 [Rhipicephalus microplus]|uniref:Uncharacterized protein n=1 Tax=Rhipicephalus microplus TaxID=6941 RepID=A0A9J6DRH6_RHIMP|nr:hypothetical protein HPB51_001189 [Rhipicephalus microplus]
MAGRPMNPAAAAAQRATRRPSAAGTTAGGTTAGATTAGATTAGATTAGATTAGGPTSKGPKDFADTVTSEIQAVGDQSHGMHDDPRNAYRTRKSYLLFIEIIMAVCVIALIVGTVVMFVVSSNTGTITLKGETETEATQRPPGYTNNTGNLAAPDGDSDEDAFTIS